MNKIAWFLISVSVVLGTVVGMAYKSGARKIACASEIPVLIAIPTGLLSVCFAVITCFKGFRLDAALLLPALLSGVSQFGAMYSLFRSMKEGFFAITIVFSGMSFCIPIFLSGLFLGEKVTAWQLSGIILMLAAIIVVNFVKRKENREIKAAMPRSKKWIIWAMGVWLFNGLLNFGIKLQQHAMPGEGMECFNFFNFLFCTVLALLFICINGFRKSHRAEYSSVNIKSIILPCLVLAFGCGLNFYIQAVLPGLVNASVQFTVCNGGSLILGVLLGVFYYREPFDWRSIVTLLCSGAAIALQVI